MLIIDSLTIAGLAVCAVLGVAMVALIGANRSL